MLSGETGRKNRQTKRQTDKETKRQTDKESKAQAQRYAYFSGALGVSYCLLVCFVVVCYGHLQPSAYDKVRFVLYYAYNIANI